MLNKIIYTSLILAFSSLESLAVNSFTWEEDASSGKFSVKITTPKPGLIRLTLSDAAATSTPHPGGGLASLAASSGQASTSRPDNAEGCKGIISCIKIFATQQNWPSRIPGWQSKLQAIITGADLK